MYSALKNILSFPYKSIRRRVMRRTLCQRLQISSNIRFQVAHSSEDFTQAFRLVHDCYVNLGITSPHESGLRCNRFSVAPGSTVLVAKDGDSVVATVTLVTDGLFGLPSDAEYLSENNDYRRQGAKLIEVSGMAVHKDYRKHASTGYLNLNLMGFLFQISQRYLGGTHLIAVVHPKSQEFYETMFGFSKRGSTLNYNFAKGALAVHLSTPLGAVLPYVKSYSCNDAVFLPLFRILTESQLEAFCFPQQTRVNVIPSIDRETFEQVIDRQACAFAGLNTDQLLALKSYYETYFEIPTNGSFRFLKNRNDNRKFRFPTEILAKIEINKGSCGFVELSNLSTTGCRINLPRSFCDRFVIDADCEITLNLVLPDSRLVLGGKIVWQKESEIGVLQMGMRFLENSDQLVAFLKSLHLKNESELTTKFVASS